MCATVGEWKTLAKKVTLWNLRSIHWSSFLLKITIIKKNTWLYSLFFLGVSYLNWEHCAYSLVSFFSEPCNGPHHISLSFQLEHISFYFWLSSVLRDESWNMVVSITSSKLLNPQWFFFCLIYHRNKPFQSKRSIIKLHFIVTCWIPNLISCD